MRDNGSVISKPRVDRSAPSVSLTTSRVTDNYHNHHLSIRRCPWAPAENSLEDPVLEKSVDTSKEHQSC